MKAEANTANIKLIIRDNGHHHFNREKDIPNTRQPNKHYFSYKYTTTIYSPAAVGSQYERIHLSVFKKDSISSPISSWFSICSPLLHEHQ
jgi:hypothetical protein